MAITRGFEPKTKLEPAEQLTCAYFHLICGMAQQDLASLFRVNSGRVNEAVTAVRDALEYDEVQT